MGQRLLLVDSDRSFLKEHQVSLEAAFDLELAASPDGVLAKLETGAFAAVFICVEVSDNKGYALCSSIRKNAKLDGVKIALISAKATEEEYRRHQSLKGRADLYLHKPMAPSALVAALAPLVPGRTLDPDNPLGELVDTELGDDWLDSLKGALDGPAAELSAAPVFGVRPSSPVQTTNLDRGPALSTEVPPDSRHVRLLEDQVANLHEEMRAKDQRLAAAEERLRAAEAEAQQIQRQLNSVTLNLDELERSTRESDTLKARLAETEAALRALEETRGREGESAETLKAQLKEALTERTDLIQQVETLNQQVGEKAQRAIELLKERDRLLHETIDLEPFKAKAGELEATLAEKEAALAARQQELDAAQLAQGQLHTTIEGLVEQHTTLEGVHQATLLEVVGYKEKAHGYQLEIAGLEATMRGQGRDLAELGVRLRQVETELEASQALVLERDQQLLARQEILQQHQEEIAHLGTQLAAIRQELDETNILHDGQRLELMNGLDQKEAEIMRLNQVITELQESHAALEREKQAVHGQLSEHRDRLQNLDGLFQEIQDKLRRGSDLARG
ncbi:MAG: response regulator [Geothrix sp.]|uniref:response regulator n=1 Tax=Geothrix sp. TaxID=1962974 RepID=UPI001847590B|nr:response regulator [Geothrix sp.]NWJ41371.1 response regulator [Geothrix sp.]WIL20642.1 MAG: response regulator [Geothrix sp.]